MTQPFSPWYLLKRNKAYVCTKNLYHMFIVVLFVVTKKWKQPKYTATSKCMNKLWLHTYHGVLPSNKKELSRMYAIQMDLKILSSVKEARKKRKKNTYCVV